MTLRRVLTLLFVLAAGAHVSAAPAQTDRTAFALLHAAAEAPLHVSFVAQVELLTIGSHGSDASIFRVEHRAPNLTRRWYLAPSNVYGDWTVSRGDSTYAVDVKHHRVVVTRHDAFGVHFGWRHNLALLTRNYAPILGPDAQIAGRRVRTISLVNRYTGATTMRLWVDAATGLMLQRQVYATDGSLVVQMHFAELRITNDIPISTFSLPANYAQTIGPSRSLPSNNPARAMAESGFAARAPRFLPEGFTPVAADVGDEKGIRTLHILYSDGLRTISLFENARGAAVDMSGYHPVALTVGPLHVESVDRGPTTLFAWSQGNLHYALVGDLNREDLEKIALSLAQ
ncbi:MAG: sigma-E factor regulatory protein RseB domain-containing protein [Candidatus Tyrphobacter sp.]